MTSQNGEFSRTIGECIKYNGAYSQTCWAKGLLERIYQGVLSPGPDPELSSWCLRFHLCHSFTFSLRVKACLYSCEKCLV